MVQKRTWEIIGKFLFCHNFQNFLEKLFLTRLDNFINAKDILNSSQYGVHKAMSTSHAVLELIENILTNNEKLAIGVFFDLKKAFDTADDEVLIEKFNFCGVREVGNDWIKSYLTIRKQFIENKWVRLGAVKCNTWGTSGIHLSPKLVVLYINDIRNV